MTERNEALAWQAMCAKLTGLPPSPIPLWQETLDRLFRSYREGRGALASMSFATRTFVCVAGKAIAETDGCAACEVVVKELGALATHVRELLDRASLSNEQACEAALRDAVWNAADCAIRGAEAIHDLMALDAEMMASDEAPIFKGGPVRAMLLALRYRLGWEVALTLTMLGQAECDADSGVRIHLGPADFADPHAFARRVADYWTGDPAMACCTARLGLSRLRDGSALEVAA